MCLVMHTFQTHIPLIRTISTNYMPGRTCANSQNVACWWHRGWQLGDPGTKQTGGGPPQGSKGLPFYSRITAGCRNAPTHHPTFPSYYLPGLGNRCQRTAKMWHVGSTAVGLCGTRGPKHRFGVHPKGPNGCLLTFGSTLSCRNAPTNMAPLCIFFV